MHVRTRLKLFQRAKMWPTTYRSGWPARRCGTWRGSHPATPGPILEFIYTALPQNPPQVGKPLERELDHGAHRGGYRVIYEFQKEDQAVLVVRVDHRARVYRQR